LKQHEILANDDSTTPLTPGSSNVMNATCSPCGNFRVIPDWRITLLFIASLSSPLLTCPAQGPLAPPGAPAPTMKSLAQIEPRIPINAANTPGDSTSTYHIIAPGSYYLTTNVVGEALKHGIKIEADNVTLDLSGFTLQGVGGSSVQGIAVLGTRSNLVVRNGAMIGWGQHGLSAFNAVVSQFTDLQATRNGNYGFATGSGSVLKRCIARANGLEGFLPGFNNVLSECTSVANSTHGFSLLTGTTIELSTAASNGGDGIRAQSDVTIRGCAARVNGLNGITAFRSTIEHCTSSLNTNHGILATNSSLIGCTVVSNGGNGIATVNASSVVNCFALTNRSNGIEVDDATTVTGCTSQGNATNGIVADSNCRLVANMCAGNGPSVSVLGAGIRANGAGNRIDENHLTGNRYAVHAASPSATNNLVIRNSARGNTFPFNIGPGNFLGPVNTGLILTNHPWANFAQ
jgi:hypothetical protein